MAITYKVVKCRNPKYPEVDYYNGRAVKTGDYEKKWLKTPWDYGIFRK